MSDLQTAPSLAAPARTPHLELLGWRRAVTALYAEVRAQVDGEAAWRHWRARRDVLFGEHPQSPLAGQPGFAGLPLFPYDPALRFQVALDPPAERAGFDVPAGADGSVTLLPAARTRGLAAALGGELTLYWIGGYGGGLFLPFGDATNGAADGRGSFGGGRYLLDTIKGADLGEAVDGRALLDFNFAYNPSCAYSTRWVCPLAPAENRLPGAVAAGEKAPPGATRG
jgi:uncharacterized protein (DUF1684 family)